MDDRDAHTDEAGWTARRAGRWSLGMLAFVPVAYVAAYAIGVGLGSLLGVEEGEMLNAAGLAGYVAGVLLIGLLCAPQAVGVWLGERARRAGATRLGLAGMIANGVLALYFVVVSAVGLVFG
ncbi:MAG: hypothetical protein ACO3KD_07825 [Gaiellales bacterium]